MKENYRKYLHDPTLNIDLIYLVVHFFFWSLLGKKKYHEMCDEDIEEITFLYTLLCVGVVY